MDNLESNPAPQPGPTPEPGHADWQAHYESLRHLITFVLLMLIVVSGTLNMLLLRQWRWAQADLLAVRQQGSALITDYKKNGEPVINGFVGKLVEFSQTHPDFNPILVKYGIKSTGPTSAVPGTATAPLGTTKTKK